MVRQWYYEGDCGLCELGATWKEAAVDYLNTFHAKIELYRVNTNYLSGFNYLFNRN
jgi:hypothetical protein